MKNNDSTVRTKTLPANAKLTAGSFVMNRDGTVTVKDAAIANLLKESLPGAVRNPDTKAVKVSVGVDF